MRKPRYEFTTNWVFEQAFKREHGVAQRNQDSYNTLRLAQSDELAYLEKMRKEGELYREMEDQR
jgi:hypothetical protein